MLSQIAGIQITRSISTNNLVMQALRMVEFDVAAASPKRSPTCSIAKLLQEIKDYGYKMKGIKVAHTGRL